MVGHDLSGAGRRQHDRRDHAEQRQIRRLKQLGGVRRHNREEHRDCGPQHRCGEGDARERAADLGRDGGTGDLPAAAAPAQRLGKAEREQGHEGGGGQEHDVGQPQRIRRPLGQEARDQGPGAAASGLRQPRQQGGAAGVAVGLEVDQRRRRGARGHADREALERAPGEEPGRALREREDDQAGGAGGEPHQEDDPPAQPVGELAEEHERRHEHEGVEREDGRQDRVREPESLAVDGVERCRQVHPRHQHDPGDPHDGHRAHRAAGRRGWSLRCPPCRRADRGGGRPPCLPRRTGGATSQQMRRYGVRAAVLRARRAATAASRSPARSSTSASVSQTRSA